MTLYDEVLDLFTLRIINVRAVCSVANALQERRFTSVRSADDKDPKMANTIEMLFDFSRIETNSLGHFFDTWEVVGHHLCTRLIDWHDQGRSLTITHSFS